MLFDHDEKMILPSFWGSTGIMLVVGAVLYAAFLLFSGATLMQGVLCLWLFLEMVVNWNAMSYLTAIKRLQKHSVFFCCCSAGGVYYVMRAAGIGVSAGGIAVVCGGAWLWRDAGMGCTPVASVFSAKS